MKLIELITKLQEIQKEFGNDIEVCYDYGSPLFPDDPEVRNFDSGNENDELDKTKPMYLNITG